MTIINSVGPTSNQTGSKCMKRESRYGYDGCNSYKIVSTTLPKEHNLNRRYGIDNFLTMYYDGYTYCELEGKTFADRPFQVAASTRNSGGLDKTMRNYKYLLEQTHDMTIPDFVATGARNIEQDKTNSADVIKSAPDSVKPNLKLWRVSKDYRIAADSVITSELDKNHYLNREYGIERMEVHNLKDGNRYIKLWGKTFNGRNFYERVSSFTNTTLGNNFRTVLERLKKTHNINISDAVVIVSKFLK